VTRTALEINDDDKEFNETIQVRSFSNQRLAQLRSAMLVALTRGVVTFSDRICCVGGITGSNQFDTLVVVDIEREFQTLLTGSTADLRAATLSDNLWLARQVRNARMTPPAAANMPIPSRICRIMTPDFDFGIGCLSLGAWLVH